MIPFDLFCWANIEGGDEGEDRGEDEGEDEGEIGEIVRFLFL